MNNACVWWCQWWWGEDDNDYVMFFYVPYPTTTVPHINDKPKDNLLTVEWKIFSRINQWEEK